MLPKQNQSAKPAVGPPDTIGITDRVPSYGKRRVSITTLRPRVAPAHPVQATDPETRPQAAPEQPIVQPVHKPIKKPVIPSQELDQTLEYPKPSLTKPWTPEIGLRWVRDQQIAYARQLETSAPGTISLYEWHLRHGFAPDFEVLKGADGMESWCEHMSRVFDREKLSYLITKGVFQPPKIPAEPVAPAKLPPGASKEDLEKARAALDIYRERMNVRRKMIEEQRKHDTRKAYAMRLLRSAVHPQLRAQYLDPNETEPYRYWMSICKMIHQTKASVVDRFAASDQASAKVPESS